MLEAQFADEKYICADSERSSEQWPNVSKIPITKLASALLLVSLAMLVSCLASRFFEVISSMEDQYFKVTEMVSKRDSRKQDSGRGRQGQWAESGECPHQHSTYGAHQIYLDRRAVWKLGSYNRAHVLGRHVEYDDVQRSRIATSHGRIKSTLPYRVAMHLEPPTAVQPRSSRGRVL